MNLLFVGDLFGKPGRKMLSKHLPKLQEKYSIDCTIVNAENSAHGKGMTSKIYAQLMQLKIDLITMGNHTWFRKEVVELLRDKPNLIRPLNLKPEFQYFDCGVGSQVFKINDTTIRVTNLLGNSVRFGQNQTNCFVEFQNFLDGIEETDIHVVDFHAETTSEKNAFLWSFDGKVSAILGTHTHVTTNDAVITHKNTAYISDVGMTGPSNGVIGGEKTSIINKFFNPETSFILDIEKGPMQLSAVVIEFDDISHKPVSIKTILIKDGFKETGVTILEDY